MTRTVPRTSPPLDLELVARTLRTATYRAWMLSLTNNRMAVRSYEEMKAPEVGQMVVELTTIWARAFDLKGVGELVLVAQERIDLGGEPWDEVFQGTPCPTEPVYYVKNLDGTVTRWTNCQLLACPADLGLV